MSSANAKRRCRILYTGVWGCNADIKKVPLRLGDKDYFIILRKYGVDALYISLTGIVWWIRLSRQHPI
jgi:hypothetical protein